RALHHLRPSRRRTRPDKRPSVLREPTLDVIDQIGAPTEALDAELPTGLVHSIVDCRPLFDRPVQFIGKIAGHADTRDFSPDPVYAARTKAQKANITEILACRFLEHLQRCWPGNLE